MTLQMLTLCSTTDWNGFSVIFRTNDRISSTCPLTAHPGKNEGAYFTAENVEYGNLRGKNPSLSYVVERGQ
jgi:hypothetical protein